MKKLIFKIYTDDDFELEDCDIRKGIIFTGDNNQEVLDNLKKFIEDKIRKIIVLGSTYCDGITIKSFRGLRIESVENYLSQIYKAASYSRLKFNILAGNWNFDYEIK